MFPILQDIDQYGFLPPMELFGERIVGVYVSDIPERYTQNNMVHAEFIN